MLDVANQLYTCKDKCGRNAPLLSDKVYQIIKDNYKEIDNAMNFDRDF